MDAPNLDAAIGRRVLERQRDVHRFAREENMARSKLAHTVIRTRVLPGLSGVPNNRTSRPPVASSGMRYIVLLVSAGAVQARQRRPGGIRVTWRILISS